MRRIHWISAAVVTVTIALAFVLWPRCDCPDASARGNAPATPPLETRATRVQLTIDPILPLTVPRGNGTAGRNVFEFRNRSVADALPKAVPASAVSTTSSPAPEASAPQRFRRRFPYTWIGTFGPDESPLVVFRRDGEILSRRVGEEIGEGFVLRGIGIESVTVTDPEDGSRRVRLAADDA